MKLKRNIPIVESEIESLQRQMKKEKNKLFVDKTVVNDLVLRITHLRTGNPNYGNRLNTFYRCNIEFLSSMIISMIITQI